MKKINNPLLNYENKWVAMNKKMDEVVFSADTLDQLHKEIAKTKKRDVVITKVFPFDVSLVTYGQAQN